MAVTLINAFIVPEDQEAAFLEDWKQTTAVFSRAPGFIETHMHRNTGVGDGTFRFINIALWETAQAWHDAITSNPPGEATLPGVKAHPAIYEPIINKPAPRQK